MRGVVLFSPQLSGLDATKILTCCLPLLLAFFESSMLLNFGYQKVGFQEYFHGCAINASYSVLKHQPIASNKTLYESGLNLFKISSGKGRADI